MKKVPCFMLWAIILPFWATAQQEPSFTIEVSTDSVLLGNMVKVTFRLANVPGAKFEAPEFTDFRLVAGPNMNSSFSMVNGVTTQAVTYTFYLEPKEVGVFYIPPAFVETQGKVLETAPVQIKVAPNPDNIRQEIKEEDSRIRFQWDNFGFPAIPDTPTPPVPPSKKRKTTRL
jgi:hypothetical protein